MKQRIFLVSVLLSCILAGCAGSREPVETVNVPFETTMETAVGPTEPTVMETSLPDLSALGENEIMLDLDCDGKEEMLVYQDGVLRRILVLNSEGKRILMEEATIFLCDDKQTVLQYSEGSGGHTWFYYRLENGEMVPIECLVYHCGDDRYFRSTDFSARDVTLVELTEEEYRQAMAAFPCAEGKNSFLGSLF